MTLLPIRPQRILLLAVAAMLIGALAPATPVAAQSFSVDTSHASVVFSISHNGLSYIYGMFRRFGGNYTLDAQNPANSSFNFSIDPASIDTNNGQRDEHLKGPDFFNVQQFPEITFQSTGCNVEQGADGSTVYVVDGNLTLHGVTQPLQMRMQLLGQREGRGGLTNGFYGSFTLKRSDYGMNYGLPGTGDLVSVNVSFEGREARGGRRGGA